MSLERRWTHVGARRDIRGFFEHQLADRSAEGRVPRAIMGRYLSFLFYFDERGLGRTCMPAPEIARLEGHSGWVAALCVPPETGRLASGGHDGKGPAASFAFLKGLHELSALALS